MEVSAVQLVLLLLMRMLSILWVIEVISIGFKNGVVRIITSQHYDSIRSVIWKESTILHYLKPSITLYLITTTVHDLVNWHIRVGCNTHDLYLYLACMDSYTPQLSSLLTYGYM